MHLLYFLVRFSLQQSLQTLRIIKKFTIFSTVIGLKKVLFSTYSLAKLLLDSFLSESLLPDSSISQSHSKLWF